MMSTFQWMIASAPEIFLLLAISIGTMLGRQKFYTEYSIHICEALRSNSFPKKA